MRDMGLLVLRSVTGGIMAGHGAQKLFGAFGGPGLQGTAGFMESLGLTPGIHWARAAALSEFGGGVLTVLGLGGSLGPIGMISSMSMATAKVHWGKPIWATEGGAELPAVYIAAALAMGLAGPGRYSLDSALGIKIPSAIVAAAVVTAATAVGWGIAGQPAPQPEAQELSGGEQV